MAQSDVRHSERAWVRNSIWAIGTVLASALIGNVCMMLGALLAFVLEAGVTPDVGVVFNWAALALMIIAYAAALLILGRILVACTRVPFAVWPALTVYPLVWSALVALPGDVYQMTPSIVMGIGALVAWVALAPTSRRSVEAVNG